MNTSNFSFLQGNYPKLAMFGKQAESYAYSDTQAAVFKLRAYTELLVEYVYQHLRLEIDPSVDLCSRLNYRQFQKVVSQEILGKLHTIRKYGNKAVHNNRDMTADDASWLIEECYLVGRWFIQAMQGSHVVVPEYVAPVASELDLDSLVNDNDTLQSEVLRRADLIEKTQAELEAIKQELHVAKNAQQSAEINADLSAELLRQFQHSSREASKSFNLKMEETRKRVSIFDGFEDVELTAGQQQAITSIEGFLNTPDLDSFILNGYAGTGKTFITKGIVEYITALGRTVVLMAPTGKAAKVISDKTLYPASTIHRAIYDFEDDFKSDDEESVVTSAKLKRNEHCDDAVYIIDEASMLSDAFSATDSIQFGSGYLLKDLMNFVRDRPETTQRKIIFVGDDAQLPPVGMNHSPALCSDYLNDNYGVQVIQSILDEVIRQKADSGVMDNALMLRNALSKDTYNQLDFDLSKCDIESLTAELFIDRYMQLCQSQVKNTKEVVIIAHSNAQVAVYNRQCREVFFPGENEICRGEKVIAVANHYLSDLTVTNGEFGMIRCILSASESRSVILNKKLEDGTTETISVPLIFRDVELLFRDEVGNPVCMVAKVIEHLLYNDQPALTSDEMKALYVDFLNRHPELRSKSKRQERKDALKADPYFNAFKVKFGYAITCHKAQGSEWQNVLVNCASSHQNKLTKDYFRWLYTAITRTSSKLYVLNAPQLKLGGGSKVVGGNDWFVDDVQPATPPQTPMAEGDNTFGILESQYALKDLLRKVQSRIANTGIVVTEIHHYQYQELYVFKAEDNIAEVQFYTSKRKVSTVTVQGAGLLQITLQQLLMPLQGVVLSTVGEATTASEYSFAEDYLEEFHHRVVEVFSGEGLVVSELVQNPWTQRYTFSQNGDTAVIDFYYNGKKQFNKIAPEPNLSSSKALLKQAVEIWSKA